MPKNAVLTGEKKVKGHKRHIVTDTQGRLLFVQVHAANIHDTKGGCGVFEQAVKAFPSLKGVCADAGYRRLSKDFERTISSAEAFIKIALKAVIKQTI